MPHPTVQLQGLDPGKFETDEYELRDVPEGLPRVPFLAGIFGSRGAGKTTAMINLIRAYQKPGIAPAWDHIIIFSPTAGKDPKYKALEEQLSTKDTRVEMLEDFTLTKFQELINYMDAETKSYETKKLAWGAYQKFKEKKMDVTKLKEDELLALYAYDFEPDGKIKSMYKHGRPSFLMVFDDLVGEKLVYSISGTNLVSKFALRHRHYNCTMMFLSQSWSNGIPRQIRHNLSLAIFFRVNSGQLKKDVAAEMSSFISDEEFIELWDEATEDAHNYFMIDFAAKPEFKFRKNLDFVFQDIRSSVVNGDSKKRKKEAVPLPNQDEKKTEEKEEEQQHATKRRRARSHGKLCKVGPGSLQYREILRGL
jgi:hypothetical protein